MPELEYEPDAESTNGAELSTGAGAERTIDLPTDAGSTRLRLPADADEEEVAALVSAVAARIREDDAEESAETQEADRWCLADRVGARRRYELPRQCRRGGEWKAASRCP